MFLLNLIFYCTVLIKNINSTSVYRYLVDGYVDGPTEEGVSTIPVNHILLGDTSIDALDKFMITGWFMVFPSINIVRLIQKKQHQRISLLPSPIVMTYRTKYYWQ